MIKAAVIGVIAVLLAIPLKKDKPEISMLLIMAAGLLLVGMSLQKLTTVLEMIQKLQSYIKNSSMYLDILIKMVGITYVAEFSSNLCSDAGYGTIAKQIEFFGKVMIIAVSVPILNALVDLIMEI